MTISSDVRQQADWASHSVAYAIDTSRLLVWVDGDDRESWLNGQLTNDVRSRSATRSVTALFLTPKGRVLADAAVFSSDDERLGMWVPVAAWKALSVQLEKYIIMEDVTLVPSDARLVHVVGPRRRELIETLTGVVVRETTRWGSPGLDVLVPHAELDRVTTELAKAAATLGGGPVGEEAIELVRLRLGAPAFGAEYGETTYPQEAGLKHAVSFQKGCYLGQEVVCMLENRGQLTRLLVALEADDGADLAPHAALALEDGTEVGQLTSFVRDEPADRGLAMVKRKAAEVGTRLRAITPDGSRGLVVRSVVGEPA